jgi:fluoroacetyl-CoA thioesterase
MKASLQPGVARVSRITVDRDRTISFMGDAGRAYATPWLVSDIEYTCDQIRGTK